MALNRGKMWERCFQESWKATFPSSFILRIPDQQSGYIGTSSNVSDFIAFKSPYLYLIECKSTKGNTLPLSNLKQYERLLLYKDLPYVKIGFIVWWIDKGVTAWVPLHSVTDIKKDNKKSIHVDYVTQKLYNIIEVKNEIKRIYPKCDLSVMLEEENYETNIQDSIK